MFELLYYVCSLRLNLDNPREPFSPSGEPIPWRLITADDFSAAHLDTLLALIPEIMDSELRARIADILWYRRRGGYQIARLAVQSYLDSAQLLEDPRNWTQCFDRVERAIQLAVSLGKNNDLFTSTIAHIEGVLDRHKGEDPLFLSAKMMEILIDHRQGDPSRYAAIAEKAAKGAEISREGVKWHIARTYWTIKSRWHDIEGDAEKSREAKLAAAETYVKEGEDALQRPSSGHSVAAHFLQGAIEALKKIENTRDERQEIYQKMLEYQKKSISEMGTHPYSIDVSEIADKAIEMVKGKSLFEALMNLAFSSPSPKVDRLRTRVQEAVRTHPMSHIFSASLLDKEGKVVGRRPGISSREEASEEAIRSEMFRMAASDQVVHAQAVVQNAIYQINLEHNVRFDDLLPVVSNNPFVPPGREYIFARGLHSGLTGDLLLMAHLLIPQLENSLRHLLSQRGVIVSGLDDQQIQENYTLNAILYRYKDELTDILGDDALFDLQGLLVERFGSNLRNLLAHGLLDQNEFFSWHILYLWWLVLRLCLTPIYIQIQRQREHSNTETNNNADSTEDNQNNN